MDYDDVLKAVHEAMDDPVGQALASAQAATDDLVVFANDQKTRQQIFDNPKVVSRILANIELVASLVESSKPRTFKVYHGRNSPTAI